MKKILSTKLTISLFLLLSVLIAGCGRVDTSPSPTITNTPTATPGITGNPTESPMASPTNPTSPTETPDQDAMTTPSIVNTNEAFEKAISRDGTWIVCLLSDLSFDKDLVLEGEFKNGKKDTAGKDVIQRKIALYEQDDNREITARYTLTAPKLTINSPEARIQSGTFKGDLYVSSKNFQLVDTTVEGNVFFANGEAQSTFKMDDTSEITGKQEIKK